MKKHLCLLGWLVVFSFSAQSQGLITLSDSARISLITCSPGKVAYERFGHSAIRIYDPVQDIDLTANWGVFSFSPDFYFKFVHGYTRYRLEVYPTMLFLEDYSRRGSRVTEQILTLKSEERQLLAEAIMKNNLPENKYYLYNFIYDNCATRAGKMILDVVRPYKILEPIPMEIMTYRQWIALYMGKQSWGQFGIDLALGSQADYWAIPIDAMFLPDMVSLSLDNVMMLGYADTFPLGTPLVVEKRVLLEQTRVDANPLPVSVPLCSMLLLLAVGLAVTYYEQKQRRHFKAIDCVLLALTGLTGVLIFYLMFFSIHPLVKSNFNLLWCNPLNLIAAILIWVRGARLVLNIYLLGYIIMILAAVIFAAWGVQSFNVAFFPLLMLMFVRALHCVVKSGLLSDIN